MVMLPKPKWYQKKDVDRTTAGDLLNNFKVSIMGKGH
jgi:hypothetical protein